MSQAASLPALQRQSEQRERVHETEGRGSAAPASI